MDMETRDRDYRMGQANVAAVVVRFIDEYRLHKGQNARAARAKQLRKKLATYNTHSYVEGTVRE